MALFLLATSEIAPEPNATNLAKRSLEEPDSAKYNKKIKTELAITSSVKEIDVGIHCFIGIHESFTGIIKHRYSDFLVNELNVNGEVVDLTNTESTEEGISKPALVAAGTNPPDVLLDEQWTSLEQLATEITSRDEILISVDDLAKEQRQKIHESIRIRFGGQLLTSTADRGKNKFIVAKNKIVGSNRNERRPWPSERAGDYTYFTLYKENRDTAEALSKISKLLGSTNSGIFQFAGNKDKRGMTTQLVSVYRVEANRLYLLNKITRPMGILLGDVHYCKKQLALGQLAGNRFKMAIRDVQVSNENLEKAIASLKVSGFINYYGLQRFGTNAVPTHKIGKSLLQSRWKEAIDLILTPKEADGDRNSRYEEFKRVWMKTHDAKAALRHVINKSCAEVQLLRAMLNHNANDHVGVLNSIPRNTRLIYIHAYQSYVWNLVASKRFELSGLSVMAGDLIISGDEEKPTIATVDQLPGLSIYDVVIPQPGYDVIYPDNQIKDYYKDVLKEDGLTMDSFLNSVKQYSCKGSYRRLIARAANLSYSIVKYDDPNADLLPSRINSENVVKTDSKDGRFKAIILEFELNSSTYATMCVRELMRSDGSTHSNHSE